MKKLDLHGVKHADVEIKVEDFVMNNQYRTPVSIITGNSDTMKNKVIKVLEEHDFKWLIRSHNLGEIIVIE